MLMCIFFTMILSIILIVLSVITKSRYAVLHDWVRLRFVEVEINLLLNFVWLEGFDGEKSPLWINANTCRFQSVCNKCWLQTVWYGKKTRAFVVICTGVFYACHMTCIKYAGTNDNKTRQSANRVHNSWDVLSVKTFCEVKSWLMGTPYHREMIKLLVRYPPFYSQNGVHQIHKEI